MRRSNILIVFNLIIAVYTLIMINNFKQISPSDYKNQEEPPKIPSIVKEPTQTLSFVKEYSPKIKKLCENEYPRTKSTKLRLPKNIDFQTKTKDSKEVYIKRTRTEPSFFMQFETKDWEALHVLGDILYKGVFGLGGTTMFRYLLKESCNNGTQLVVDVGSNMGYFSLYSAMMGCRVKAYEAVSSTARVNKNNIILNDLESRIELNLKAVSNVTGDTVKMKLGVNIGINSVVTNDYNYEIETVSLKSIINEDLVLLKIDIEGYEDILFNDIKESVSDHHIENILMEMRNEGDMKNKIDFINSMIHEKQYYVYSFFEDYNVFEEKIAEYVAFGWHPITLRWQPIYHVENSWNIPHTEIFFTKTPLM